jgi:hypothetical protein
MINKKVKLTIFQKIVSYILLSCLGLFGIWLIKLLILEIFK